jgi:short-subunit dehydrogenase
VNIDFSDQKLVIVGGSSGMGQAAAMQVAALGGRVVVIGKNKRRVDETVKMLSNHNPAYGIAADLADRKMVEDVRKQLADEHMDANLLMNAAGLFVPKRPHCFSRTPTRQRH